MRIDRFLISKDWKIHFPGVVQFVLARPVLNHFLILLEWGGLRSEPTPFKFENIWLKEEAFKTVLRSW